MNINNLDGKIKISTRDPFFFPSWGSRVRASLAAQTSQITDNQQLPPIIQTRKIDRKEGWLLGYLWLFSVFVGHGVTFRESIYMKNLYKTEK